ncbi:MAG: coproporphyrinogen III oxidase, partial [Sphingobacterium sp.]
MTREIIAEKYKEIQHEITTALEALDGEGKFEEELWQREGGGGGRTRVIQ